MVWIKGSIPVPAGIIRFYLDEGTPMQKLLRQLKELKPDYNFLGTLLKEFDSYSQESDEVTRLVELKTQKNPAADGPTLPLVSQ